MHSPASTENRGYNFTLLGRRNCLEILESFIRKAGDYGFSPLLPYPLQVSQAHGRKSSPSGKPMLWGERKSTRQLQPKTQKPLDLILNHEYELEISNRER